MSQKTSYAPAYTRGLILGLVLFAILTLLKEIVPKLDAICAAVECEEPE